MDTVFFIASKLIGALLRPDTWIIIALAIVVLAIIMQRRRLAIWLGSLTLVALATLAILPLGSLLLQPIERSYPANPPMSQVDGIIVLGGGEDARASAYWGQMQFNEGGDRFAAGLSCVFRSMRPPIPTTCAQLFRGIRPPVTRCREAACFGYQV